MAQEKAGILASMHEKPGKPFQFGLTSLLIAMTGVAIVAATVSISFVVQMAPVVLGLEVLIGWWALQADDKSGQWK